MPDCCFKIDFQKLPRVTLIIKDYLSDKLEHLHRPRFTKENALKQADLKKLNFPLKNRKILVEVLTNQMNHLPLSDLQKENIESLKDENTFTIVTGHQLNLYTGPSFFIYKILQVIKTTEFLNDNQEGKKIVPVFWMATEDHDFAEINHFKTERNFYQFTEPSGDAVGRIAISDNQFVEDFKKEFQDYTFGTEMIWWIQEAYKLGNTLTQATSILVNRLFGEMGLLFIDGDDRRLKELMIPIFKRELLESLLYKTTKETREELISKYGKVQVNPREINLFYLNHKSRNRIERTGETFDIVDRTDTFTQEQILKELEDSPERFSPNAVLRGAFQETVLPNLMYIGGNAEVAYWLELKKFFDAIDLTFPILMPRNSFAMMTRKNFKKTQKLDLKIEDLFEDFENVVHQKLLNNSPLKPLLDQKELEVSLIFKELKTRSKETDKTFENLVDAEQTRQLKSFLRMKKRLLRAEKIVQGDLYQRYNLLFEEVNPGGIWQERVINFSAFYADGGRQWIRRCYDATDVEKSELSVLVL